MRLYTIDSTWLGIVRKSVAVQASYFKKCSEYWTIFQIIQLTIEIGKI